MKIREDQLLVLQADPTPFFLEGGPTGVLLIHGFTGTPREMRRVGDYLHGRGLTVSAPLLPGHGTSLAAVNRVSWREWTAAVEAAYRELAARCRPVFVGGHSMGSLLTIWLGARFAEVAGLILYAPAYRVADWKLQLTPVARYVVGSVAKSGVPDIQDPEAQAWLGGFARYPVPAAAELLALQRRVRRLLPHVRQPALVVYSVGDRSIHPTSGPEMVRRLGSAEVETLVLTTSGHGLTADVEWEQVAEATYRFITRLAGPAAG